MSTASPGQSLRVLFIAQCFTPKVGGRASLLRDLIRNLPGDRTSVSTPGAPGAREADRELPARVHRGPAGFFGAGELGLTLWRRRLTRICRSERPGIVVASGGTTEGLLAQHVRQKRGLPYVLQLEAPELARIGLAIRADDAAGHRLQRMISEAAGIVVGGPTCRFEAYKLGVYPHHLHVVRPGVDLETFRPGEAPPALSERLGHRQGPVLVAVLGESTEHDLETLLRALASLRHQRRGARLVVIESEPTDHGALVRELRLEEAVHFVGRLPPSELPDWYRLADVFVLARRKEAGAEGGIPVALMEAMASGCAIVATRSAGVEEIARADEDALLVGPGAHAKLAKSVLGLLREEDSRAALASQARQRAESEFGAPRFGRDFREYLEVLYFRRLGLGTLEPPAEPPVQETSPAV